MTRTITYTLPRFPSTTFTVELLDLFVLPDGTYPRRKQTCPTDAGGAGSVVLDVPSDGAVRYRWRLPDGSQRDSAIGAGADTTLELLLAASTPGVASDACSIPAYDNATPQSAIATYNAGIEALATARGIPYADFHTATADPSTGYYLPGMRLDGVHPTGTGGKAMGQVLRDALESHLPATTPTLVTSATEASGWLWQNGAMLRDSNSDGTPNGGGTESATAWGRTSGAADASFSLVAESGVVSGNWMRVNKTANTATTTLLGNGISVSDNHLIGYGALIKATLSSGAAVTLQWYKSSNTSQREYGITLQGYVGDIAPFVWYLEKTVPASTSQVRPNLSISGGTADVYLGQLTVRDLG